jgi:lipoate-protein ligase B
VGYPIVALGERYDVLGYLRKLEAALIRTAVDLGVPAHRDPDHTGVWVGTNKLGAIGVKITRGVSMHGFALNVTTDLDMFGGIVPCGIQGRWVTSIERETGARPALKSVAEIAAGHVAEVLGRPLLWTHRNLADASISRSARVSPRPIVSEELKEESSHAQS